MRRNITMEHGESVGLNCRFSANVVWVWINQLVEDALQSREWLCLRHRSDAFEAAGVGGEKILILPEKNACSPPQWFRLQMEEAAGLWGRKGFSPVLDNKRLVTWTTLLCGEQWVLDNVEFSNWFWYQLYQLYMVDSSNNNCFFIHLRWHFIIYS